MLRPRFIPKSVFYTQTSIVHSPCFILTVREIDTNDVYSVAPRYGWYARRRAFGAKNFKPFSDTTLNRLGFGGTAKGYFYLRNNETEGMLVNQKEILWELNSFPM